MTTPKIKVLIYTEKGRIWPIIKVDCHSLVEVVVVDNDQAVVWKPQIAYGSGDEVNKALELANELESNIGLTSLLFKKEKDA